MKPTAEELAAELQRVAELLLEAAGLIEQDGWAQTGKLYRQRALRAADLADAFWTGGSDA